MLRAVKLVLCLAVGGSSGLPAWNLLWKSPVLSSSAPLPTSYHAAATAGSSLFVHGGVTRLSAYEGRFGTLGHPRSSSPLVPESWSFDTSSASWRNASSTQFGPGGRAQHCACYHNASRSVYIFGGWAWGESASGGGLTYSAVDSSDVWRASLAFNSTDGSGPIRDWSWSFLGSAKAAQAAGGIRWPEARRAHACACGPDRMLIHGGFSIGQSGIRSYYGDTWEWVPSLVQVPTGYTVQGNITYGVGWQGAWRKIAITPLTRNAPATMPASRYWASAAVVQLPWYMGVAVNYPICTGNGGNPDFPGFGLLDVLVLAGGQLSGGSNSDIDSDGILPPDTTWALILDECPGTRPTSTQPTVILSLAWLPPAMPNRDGAVGLPMYTALPRNGTWIPLSFLADGQSGPDGYLNRWSGSLAVAGGDTLVWVGGSSFVDPTTEAGSSIGLATSSAWSLSAQLDIEPQVEVAMMSYRRRMADDEEHGRQKSGTERRLGRYSPQTAGWAAVKAGGASSTAGSSNEAGVPIASSAGPFLPRFGHSLLVVNATAPGLSSPPSTAYQYSYGSAAGLYNGGGSGSLLVYGGWHVDVSRLGGDSSGPSNEVWRWDVSNGAGGAPLITRELQAADFKTLLTRAPGLPPSGLVGVVLGVCSLFILCMCCCMHENFTVRMYILLVSLPITIQAEIAVTRCIARLNSREGGLALQAMTLAEMEEVARREADLARRAVTQEELDKLPTFTFSSAAAGDALGSNGSSGGGNVSGSGVVEYFLRAARLSSGQTVGTDIAGTSCPICLVDYEDSNHLRRLPCGHFFHSPCVDVWLRRSSKQCPMCKHDVREDMVLRSHIASGNGVGTGNASRRGSRLYMARMLSALRVGRRHASTETPQA